MSIGIFRIFFAFNSSNPAIGWAIKLNSVAYRIMNAVAIPVSNK